MLIGDALVVTVDAHRGHHACIPIVPARRPDTGVLAHSRGFTVRPHQEGALEPAAILQGDGDASGLPRDLGRLARGDDLDPGRQNRLRQGRAYVAVLDQVPEGLAAVAARDLRGVKA